MIRPALIALALPVAAAAQATDPGFAREVREAVPAAGSELGLIRCAALFRTVAAALGPDLLGPEMTQAFAEAERRFGASAAMIRADEADLERAAAIDAVIDGIAAVAPLYRDRYAANRAARGHSWAGDAMLSGDAARCQALLEDIG